MIPKPDCSRIWAAHRDANEVATLRCADGQHSPWHSVSKARSALDYFLDTEELVKANHC
jgi:hypothetical protein